MSGVSIEVFSDVVCPWCFVGKKRLEAALARLAREEPGLEPAVVFRAFELNPDMPADGMPREEYLLAKFGHRSYPPDSLQRLRSAFASVGLEPRFEAITRQPNTFDAHRVIRLGQAQGRGEAVAGALFEAYFLEGRRVGERDVLVEVAAGAGMDPQALRAALDRGEAAEDVREDEREAKALGVNGVPFFVIGRRVGVSGAQTPEVLLEAIRQARTA
jgi:predicted DsbA family dithiol-disulfide isomerase